MTGYPMRRLYVLYALLLAVASMALLGWIVTSKTGHHVEWISVWAPHVCVAALELLLATAVLDRWTRHQEAALRHPLRLAAEHGMRAMLCDLGTMLLIQRAYLAALPHEIPKVADAFDTGQWEIVVREAHYAWLERWEHEMARTCSSLALSIGRYEEVLDPPCAAAAWRLLSEWEVGAGARLRARIAHVQLVARRVAADAEEGTIDYETQADILAIIAICRDLWYAFGQAANQVVELRSGLEGNLRLIDVIRRSTATVEH